MKQFFFIFTWCVFLSAYAYEKKPDVLIERARDAAKKLDVEKFSKFVGRKALCDWGTTTALQQLQVGLGNTQLSSDLTRLTQGYLAKARFSGFWIYYEQIFDLKVLNKRSRELIAEGKVECHWGAEGVKRESDLNRPLDAYPIKSCRIVLLEPRTFNSPAARPECAIFRQTL
jgi:DNA-binding transcriptional ArsR family regulator